MRLSQFISVVAFTLSLIVIGLFFMRSNVDRSEKATERSESAPSPTLSPEIHDAPHLSDTDPSHDSARVPVETDSIRTPASHSHQVTIHVVDAETSKPSPRLSVSLTELRNSGSTPGEPPTYHVFGVRQHITDAAGDAIFEGVDPAHYRVKADGPGAFSESVEFDAIADAEQTIELRAWRAAGVHGIVVDETGAPVPYAHIEATLLREKHGRQNGFNAKEDGAFGIDDFDVGEDGVRGVKMRVRASSRNWLESAQLEFEIHAGPNEVPAPLVLHGRAATLRGRVVDALGVPLPGAEVDCPTLLAKKLIPVNTRTDARGQFSFGSLESGFYVLSCKAICLAGTPAIQVAAGADVDIGDLKPPPERFDVTGVAVFEDGKPAAGARATFAGITIVLGEGGAFTFSRCSNEPGDLGFAWDDSSEHAGWSQVEHGVIPGGAPLRIVLKPRGVIFRVVDAKTHATLTNRHYEVIAQAATGASNSVDFDSISGEFQMGIYLMPSPVTLRVVVAGYRAIEMKYERPEEGYADRQVIEIPLEKL